MVSPETTACQTRFGVLFPTKLGWMACRWNESCLAELSFGHRDPKVAWASLTGLKGEHGDIDPVLLEQSTASERARIAEALGICGGEGHSSGGVGDIERVIDLVERLGRFAEGEVEDFRDIPLDMTGWTGFRRRVTEACQEIPYGGTMTYAELGGQVGAQRGARAVGNVMRRNPWPLVVPCHRVIASNGKLGGYSAPEGLAMKQRLLALEAAATEAPAPVLLD